MKNFDTRAYSIADFFEWYKNNLLELSPDFQRRTVWSEKAKSYLIDTIVRGRPIPKILISQKLQGSRTVRIVVDGQQRLRAILEFINGDFAISRAHNTDLAGMRYPTLSKAVQNEFLQYELGVDLLFDLKYQDLLDIFARINSYTVSLNSQEKLNAKYLGFFKKAAFNLGFHYVDYFLRASILTKANVTRMAEAELSSDLLVALVDGVQTNKSIEQHYKKYEDEAGPLDKAIKQFDEIMSYIGTIYPPEELVGTNWSRIQLFYTLFTAIGHCLYGVGGLDKAPRSKLSLSKVGQVRVCLDEISATYDTVTADIDNPSAPKDYKNFIDRSRRRTTDTASRVERADFVCRKIEMSLKRAST
jgi:hypothetical protein